MPNIGGSITAVGDKYGLTGEAGIKALGQPGAIVFDVKSTLPREAADARL